MIENWRPAIYRGHTLPYFVSDKGNIKNRHGKILRQKDSRDHRYWIIMLYEGRKYYLLFLHQLVWQSFNEDFEYKPKYVVDHKDNNGKNNNLENLQYISARENVSKEKRKQRDLPTGVSITTEKNRKKQFYADIRIDGKKKNLGRYYTVGEAELAYLNALKGATL